MRGQELRLGVYPAASPSAGWERILSQEGLPWTPTAEPDAPITLFAGRLSDWVERYVAGGGIAVVSGAPEAVGLLASSERAVISRFRSPVRDRHCRAPGMVRLFSGRGDGECRLHEDRKIKDGHDPDVSPAVLTQPLGRGFFVYTGIPLTDLLSAAGDGLRRFSPFSEVTERVASVDKAEVADTLVWMLMRAFRLARIPYARLARFPDGARSVLLFRVDVDGLFGDRAKTLAEVAARHGVTGSFYFNGVNCEQHPGELAGWPGEHELGQHGYRHVVFDRREANVGNLRQGREWVAGNVGVDAAAFVAPRGLWNSALDRALSDEGYPYSSDFALDFDSLPFRTPAGVLQIPVHPYSPERAKAYVEEQGLPPLTAEQVRAHYLQVARQQIQARRPVHVYGHPEVLGSMAQEVLPDLFTYCAAEGVTALRVGEFADWWAAREQAGMRLWFDAESRLLDITFAGDRARVAEVHHWEAAEPVLVGEEAGA